MMKGRLRDNLIVCLKGSYREGGAKIFFFLLVVNDVNLPKIVIQVSE